MDSINLRRSVRSYTDQKVEPEKIEEMLRAGMQAPSAHNQQSWEFFVVEDKASLEQLSKYNPYAICLKSASMAIVVAGNKQKMIAQDYWQQELGACTQNILLKATELGLGAVWLACAPLPERMEYVKTMFNLTDDILPYCVISIGYPKWENANKFKDRYNADCIHYINRK